jgi:AcrR family transcriptional regulator
MDDAAPAAPTGLARLWQAAADPARPPRLGLSLDRVVDGAIALADDAGLEAVSMARLAKRLGFTTMSVYRYVASKDELLLFMHDRAWHPTGYTDDASRPWRERLADWCLQQREHMRRHPWLVQIRTTDRMGTPSQLAWHDHGLATLEGTPLTEDEKSIVLITLFGHVAYDAQVMADFAHATRVGHDFEETADGFFEAIRAAATPERFPSLHRAVVSGGFQDLTATQMSDPDAVFRLGMDTFLDGVELLVARRSG